VGNNNPIIANGSGNPVIPTNYRCGNGGLELIAINPGSGLDAMVIGVVFSSDDRIDEVINYVIFTGSTGSIGGFAVDTNAISAVN
jgi:hypothetical protein